MARHHEAVSRHGDRQEAMHGKSRPDSPADDNPFSTTARGGA